MSKSIAENLKKFRTDKGLSKLELARRSGVTARAIEHIEYSKTKSPGLTTLRKLADALEINVNKLIEGE